jgi:hypothetical protein
VFAITLSKFCSRASSWKLLLNSYMQRVSSLPPTPRSQRKTKSSKSVYIYACKIEYPLYNLLSYPSSFPCSLCHASRSAPKDDNRFLVLTLARLFLVATVGNIVSRLRVWLFWDVLIWKWSTSSFGFFGLFCVVLCLCRLLLCLQSCSRSLLRKFPLCCCRFSTACAGFLTI